MNEWLTFPEPVPAQRPLPHDLPPMLPEQIALQALVDRLFENQTSQEEVIDERETA